MSRCHMPVRAGATLMASVRHLSLTGVKRRAAGWWAGVVVVVVVGRGAAVTLESGTVGEGRRQREPASV